MLYKCHCLLFPAGQTSFQKRYVYLRWVLPYRLLTVPQDCLTREHVTSKRMRQTGVPRSNARALFQVFSSMAKWKLILKLISSRKGTLEETSKDLPLKTPLQHLLNTCLSRDIQPIQRVEPTTRGFPCHNGLHQK